MWPVLLLIMLKLRVKRPWMRRIVVALAAVSAIAMAVLYDPAADPSRVYYGTDTRAFSMLLGAWLAFIPEGSMSPAKLLQTVGLGKLLPQRPTSKTQGQGVEDSASGADGIASGAERAGNEKAGYRRALLASKSAGRNASPATKPMCRPTTRCARSMRSASSPWRAS